jgi:ectoine hydroxylase-related dioxygenase (phytanoyl-CoA dioxygenase family)
LHPIGPADIDAYARDGVACLRQVFDCDWVNLLLEAWGRIRADIDAGRPIYKLPRAFLERDPKLKAEIEAIDDPARKTDKAKTGFTGCKYMWHWDPAFRKFALESPAGEAVGRVMGANVVRFYWDQMFVKDAGCRVKTYWHADYPAWPVTGEMIPSLWIALSPIGKESCVETIAGTHTDTSLQWPRSFNARQEHWDKDARPDFIDYEQLRGDPGVRFLSWDMEPGDAILIHPRVHHGGGDNPDATRDRIALSTRWIGDDIRWDPRPETVNTPGLPHGEMVRGARPGDRPGEDELFPVVWRRDTLAAQAAE